MGTKLTLASNQPGQGGAGRERELIIVIISERIPTVAVYLFQVDPYGKHVGVYLKQVDPTYNTYARGIGAYIEPYALSIRVYIGADSKTIDPYCRPLRLRGSPLW